MFQAASKKRPDGEDRNDYAEQSDFCNVFQQQLDSLFVLALLLTGDELTAERCLLTAFDTCMHGGPVFKEVAASWSRRSIIKTAIRSMLPAASDPSEPSEPHFSDNDSDLDLDHDSLLKRVEEPESPVRSGFLRTRVEELPLFDRFVFVMSVLERYSDRDCALLLGCSGSDVLPARIRALQQIARHKKSYPVHSSGTQPSLVDSDWLECG